MSTLSDTVIWIHGDNLSPYSPAFEQNQGSPAVFVWDDELLAKSRISMKRIVFIYECLLELPVVIRRGDVAEEVTRFALMHNAGCIVTNESPSPRFHGLCQQISHMMPSGSRLEVLRETPFVSNQTTYDLKRFSRYWREAKRNAMKPSSSR